ncbi:CPBP family intramembrane glutamic endopeptidase [Leptospira perolatii]|nr:CPBP family intramembrane glutamic endopeptidase [Leptospira perolatii]
MNVAASSYGIHLAQGYVFALANILSIFPVFFLGIILSNKPWTYFIRKPKEPNLSEIILILLIAFGLYDLISFIVIHSTLYFPWMLKWSQSLSNGVADTDLIFAGLIVAPITEELFFRFFLFRGFLKIYSLPIAILGSASLFGLVHLLPTQVVTGFILGIYLAYLYAVSENPILPILGHFVYNGYVIFLPQFITWSKLQEKLPGFRTEVWFYGPLDLIAILGLVFGIFATKKMYEKKIANFP